MTVGELMDALRRLDPVLRVTIPGRGAHEGAPVDVVGVDVVTVLHVPGHWEYCDPADWPPDAGERVRVANLT